MLPRRKSLLEVRMSCILPFHINSKTLDTLFFLEPHCLDFYLGCVSVLQVLQYIREFDAPAVQSCKPLPCGTGS